MSYDEFDIGAIELSRDYAEELNADWILRQEVSSEAAFFGATIVALGFPTAFLNPHQDEQVLIHPTPFLFISRVVDERPTLGHDVAPINPAFDIMAHYEIDNTLFGGQLKPAPHPMGMSGCGLFTVPFLDDGVTFDFDRIQLAGIQSAFIGQRLLRGKRAELVLRLLDQMKRSEG